MSSKHQPKQKTKYLYKYKQIPSNPQNLRHLEMIFTKNVIYFPKPAELNDPFDCDPKISTECTDGELKDFLSCGMERNPLFAGDTGEKKRKWATQLLKTGKKVKDSQQKTYEEHARSIYSSLGVFCMTAQPDHILMWSHYADGHRGICLQFDRESEDSNGFNQAEKCIYSPSHPVIKVIGSEDDRRQQVRKAALTKSDVWKYEKEWRIVFMPQKDSDRKKIFRPELLTGVILGTLISSEHKELIESWVSQRNPKPKIHQAEPLEDKYGINIPDWI